MYPNAGRVAGEIARRVTLSGVLVAGLLVSGSSGAAAQGGRGIRAGVTVDPDQFHFGGHLETGPLLERVWFRPNAEIGLGDDLTLVAFNIEFAYRLPVQGSRWTTYLGGGPALNIFNFGDERRGRPGEGRDTDVEGGFNLLVGVAHQDGLFLELKVGALDSPDLKFGVGYSFR